jgi:hypothetical protein
MYLIDLYAVYDINRTSGYCCAIGEKGMKPNTGTYYWEIKVDAMASSSDWQMGIGVATSSLNLEGHLGASMPGWAYCNQGCRAHSSSSSTDRFGETYTRDDVIGKLFLSFDHLFPYNMIAMRRDIN